MTNPNPETSVFQERSDVADEFNWQEIRHLRYLLRRLRFLEIKIAEASGTKAENAPQSMYVHREADALAYLLTEIGFLRESVSGNGD